MWAYVNATYELLRPKLTNLTESIASTAEKFLQVRTQRIVQELRPIALDPDAAASLAAPVGSPAILVWRCYYLDNDDLIIIARSTYPQGHGVPHRADPLRTGSSSSAMSAFGSKADICRTSPKVLF